MNETQILNRALEILYADGPSDAYDFLVTHIEPPSSQGYNFLYCLAATSGKKEEALGWLEEAILTKELWYRPEVFEDEDLDAIRDDLRFQACVKKSEVRYLEAVKTAKTECTWTEKTHNHLILSLHGNQQNNEINKSHWHFLEDANYQVAYLQSSELDSCNLFRWEADGTGPNQLKDTMAQIEWQRYEETILCGFSAGCNVILRAINENECSCNKIILQSPWIPIVENDISKLIERLKKADTKVLMICGNNDEDCFLQCKVFETIAHEHDINIKAIYIEGLGHDYPEHFQEIVFDFLDY